MVHVPENTSGAEGVVCQCGFLNTTRFGPDVVLTTQNMIGIHYCYWCIVVLWQGLRHFHVFTVFLECFFQEGLLFLRRKKIVLVSGRKCHTKGERGTERDQKKFNFFSLHM